ncbi:MAG: hypothetical protein CMH46_15735 [Muricauda sp.]|nr:MULTISPECIES: response regulator transcription factor [unclassified Allomuricauda]MAU16979.1 hypothetical protein [Allomuricauda sp.]|tara:strand:+ start:7104 stop:8021 length:918 start_codon:yes stop_codon:yes gene_type:complete
MRIYKNIKNYFLNNDDGINDYGDRFYIRSIEEDRKRKNTPDIMFASPHKRDFFEIAILARNTTSIRIGEHSFGQMDKGLAIVSPFQTIHYEKKTYNNEESNDIGYVINFKASIFEHLSQSYEVQNQFPFFKIHTLPIYQLGEEDFDTIFPIAAEIYEEARSDRMHNLEVVQSLLQLFLYKIKRVTYNDEGIVALNRWDKITSKFEHTILSGGNEILSVSEYASKMNISPIYLTECVKKATGKSAQKVLIDYKTLQAKTLLSQEEMAIGDVAEALGFNEVANFNQFFKRTTGMTASQFRKKGKGAH